MENTDVNIIVFDEASGDHGLEEAHDWLGLFVETN